MSASSDSSSHETEELLFGGDPIAPPPEVFEDARRNQPPWYRAIEAAYKQFVALPENAGRFADPAGKGATIAQIARLFEMFGARPFCVVTRVLPAAQTESVERLERRTSDQLLNALKQLRAQDGELNVTTLHHDGKTGHCIRLTNHDPQGDWFEYHDPWPGRSLLCEENNRRGVRAEPAGKRWKVRAGELAQVLIACFVFPAYWWRADGGPGYTLLDEQFEESEFFGHFHLKHRGEESAGPVTRRAYAPGPFGRWIQIETDVRPAGRISEARLIAHRKWVGEHLDLGVDLVKSFVVALAPQGPNEGVFQETAAALWSLLHDPQAAMRLRAADPGESEVVACVHAFAGSVGRASASTELGSLTIGSVDIDGEPHLAVEMTLT